VDAKTSRPTGTEARSPQGGGGATEKGQWKTPRSFYSGPFGLSVSAIDASVPGMAACWGAPEFKGVEDDFFFQDRIDFWRPVDRSNAVRSKVKN
jgi:hypothetical protein